MLICYTVPASLTEFMCTNGLVNVSTQTTMPSGGIKPLRDPGAHF